MKTAFSVVGAVDWFRSESGKGTLKVLSGIRGAGKSSVVEMYRADLLDHGVSPGCIVHLDFEDRRMRSVKTYRDVLALLPSGDERTYLILDEITNMLDFERLMGVLYMRSNFDMLLTISNRRLMTDTVCGYFKSRISECRLFPSPGLRRTQNKLDGIWAEILLRDVLGGHVLTDVTAVEQLCGFLSDHLCEVVTKRKVAAEFTVGGLPLSANTIDTYLELLNNAYLVEFVPAYDRFTCEIAKNSGRRMFCIDPVLRAHKFGPAPEGEAERAAYNARYLELRRKYGKVYCLKDDRKYSDFVIFPNGKSAEVMESGICDN